MIDTPEKATIDSITGVQVTGKSLDDETAFFSDKTIHYFPRGLEKFYKNLVGISIFFGGLKEIHQSDLKFYPKLKVIDLYQNDIDILEDGLFDFNPLLEVISFTRNKIFHISSRIFEGLVKLGSLSFDDNVCTEYRIERNPAALQAAIPNLKNACTSQTFLNLEDEVEILEEHSIKLTRENFWNFEFRFIDFENEFRNEKFLKFLPLSIRYKFLSGLKIEDLPETCKKCCQFDDFQAKNLENFKIILNLIANLQKSQDDSFAALSAKISIIDGKIDQIEGKIVNLNQDLLNLTENFNSFVRNFNNFEDFSVTKFANIENKISQIVSQTTNSILTSIDLKLRDLENRLVNRIKSNSKD